MKSGMVVALISGMPPRAGLGQTISTWGRLVVKGEFLGGCGRLSWKSRMS